MHNDNPGISTPVSVLFVLKSTNPGILSISLFKSLTFIVAPNFNFLRYEDIILNTFDFKLDSLINDRDSLRRCSSVVFLYPILDCSLPDLSDKSTLK